MYKNICRHCHAEIECESTKQFANHVRWCNPNVDRDKNKFMPKCCCLLCNKEIVVQGLKAHLEKHNKESKPKKFYRHCLECGEAIFDKKNKFCNHSCSAKYSNRNREVRPTKPLKAKKEIVKACWIGFCKCCGKLFKRNFKSHNVLCCSKDCRMSIVSLNRGRHKKSWLEQSFASWLDSNNILYETEVTVKNKESGKWYFVDFMFESLNLIIELDGSQHKDTIESDKIRDEYLRSQGYTVIRITHEEYQSKKRIPEIEKLLGL